MFLKNFKNNHLLMSGFYKGLSGLALFASIPLLIKYLNHDDYGIWVLIFTLFQWVLVMDFGIQSTLKTKIPLLFHNSEIELIKCYIKVTYKYSVYISLILLFIFSAYMYSIDLNEALNISFHSKSFIFRLFSINIFFFCVNSVAGIHKSLYVAYLKGKYAEQSIALNQVGFLVLLLAAIYLFPEISAESKLILVSILNGVFCLLVNAYYTIRFFKVEKLNLKTKEKPSKDFLSEIIKIGLKFMIIQLGMMLFFTVDNYIISGNFSPKDVVPYDTVNKIFQLPVMILFATLSPLWSMFAKDYVERNHQNLLRSFKRFNILFISILLFIIILATLCPLIISIWIKEKLDIPEYLVLYVAVITSLRIFTVFYSYFLNGIGQLNRFAIIIILSLLIKFPLTYLLIHLEFGINSVAVSTMLILIAWVVLIPLECYRVIKRLKSESHIV